VSEWELIEVSTRNFDECKLRVTTTSLHAESEYELCTTHIIIDVPSGPAASALL
jgi:hypothetical protein